MTKSEQVQKLRLEMQKIESLLHGCEYTVNGYKVDHNHTKGGYVEFRLPAKMLYLGKMNRNEVLTYAIEATSTDFYDRIRVIQDWNEKINKTPELKGQKMEAVIEAEVIKAEEVKMETKAVKKDVEKGTGDMFLDRIVAEVSKHIKVEPTEEMIEQVVNATMSKAYHTIKIERFDGSKLDLGIAHNKTKDILRLVALRSAMPVNIMLVGAAGAGKTTCCDKVAEACGLQFFPVSVGPQTSKSDLLGYTDAHGNYVSSRVREAFENGGVLLLDEVDAAHAGVLTIINSLLENGYCSFPDRVVKKHSDFVCICACNTYGRGADRQYVGRNQLDAATLDRFAVVDFDYDEKMERILTNNDEWFERIMKYRKQADSIKARVIISPRASIKGSILLKAGFSEKEVENMLIWKGIDKELVNKIKNI